MLVPWASKAICIINGQTNISFFTWPFSLNPPCQRHLLSSCLSRHTSTNAESFLLGRFLLGQWMGKAWTCFQLPSFFRADMREYDGLRTASIHAMDEQNFILKRLHSRLEELLHSFNSLKMAWEWACAWAEAGTKFWWTWLWYHIRFNRVQVVCVMNTPLRSRDLVLWQ